MSVKARIYMDGVEIDVKQFHDLDAVQPDRVIELADAPAVVAATGTSQKFVVAKCTVEPTTPSGDSLVVLEVEPLPST